MAALEFDAPSGFYRIVFRFGGRRFKRSLKVKDAALAESIRGRVEETLADILRGRLALPPDADPGTFILSNGKLGRKPAPVATAPQPPATLGSLLAAYRAELPDGAKEANSLRTELIHLRHVERLLGADLPLEAADLASAQRYARARGKETHGKVARRPIRPYTVWKELKSFRHAWAWCYARALVPVAPPWELAEVTLPRDRDPEPFRTMAEILERIDRGGLTGEGQKELWDCLYLTGPELLELLGHVGTLRL